MNTARRVAAALLWLCAAAVVVVGAAIAYSVAYDSAPSQRSLFDIVAAVVGAIVTTGLMLAAAAVVRVRNGRLRLGLAALGAVTSIVAGSVGSHAGDVARRRENERARAACSTAEIREYGRLSLGSSASEPIGWSDGGCHVQLKSSMAASAVMETVRAAAVAKGWAIRSAGDARIVLSRGAFDLTIAPIPSKGPAVTIDLELRTRGEVG